MRARVTLTRQIGLSCQAGQVIRSHLVNVRQRWRPKVIFMSQASISEDIWSVKKMRNVGKMHLK